MNFAVLGTHPRILVLQNSGVRPCNSPERRRDKPLIAPLVFDATLPISIGLILWFQDRFPTRSHGLLIYRVAILDIHVNHCGFALPPVVGLTDADSRVADADLRVHDGAFG